MPVDRTTAPPRPVERRSPRPAMALFPFLNLESWVLVLAIAAGAGAHVSRRFVHGCQERRPEDRVIRGDVGLHPASRKARRAGRDGFEISGRTRA